MSSAARVRLLRGRSFALVKGDITAASEDAIVNAANEALAGGGGVDGAIHRAGGPSIMAECRAIGGCPTGQAVATTAGRLHARHVIHTVAPIWQGGTAGEEELLASAYRNAVRVAAQLGDGSLAFPSLGTGAYGYPADQAAAVALRAVQKALDDAPQVKSVTFYLFSDHDLEIYSRALDELGD